MKLFLISSLILRSFKQNYKKLQELFKGVRNSCEND